MATGKKGRDTGAEYAKAHGLRYGVPDPKVNKGVHAEGAATTRKRAKKK